MDPAVLIGQSDFLSPNSSYHQNGYLTKRDWQILHVVGSAFGKASFSKTKS